MKKKLLVLALVLFLLANMAYAASFEAAVVPVKDKIVVDEIAEFDIGITNNLDTNEEFTIKKAGYPFWDMNARPIQNPISLKVPARSNATLRIYVDPLYITSVDTYTLDVGIVLQRTGEEIKVPVTVGIKSTEPLISGYVPTVLTSIDVPKEIDPREEFTVKIVLDNQNVINYSELAIRASSGLFSEEIKTSLAPKEVRTIEIVKKLDGMTQPQKSSLDVQVLYGERVIVDTITKEFEIKEYMVQQELPKEQSFLKIRKGIRLVSNNPDYEGTVRIETTPLKNLIITTYPKATVEKEAGRYYLVFGVKVRDNVAEVYATENYRPIIVIIGLAIIAVVLYFVFRSPIVVKKSVASVSMSEGGISEAKIVVRVKNRSPAKIEGIEVADTIPHIAHVEKDVSIGSMHPHAVVQHPKKGAIIKWMIESLEAGDERVLSYRMKSRLSILGEFSLPAASARTKVGNRLIISNSNRVSVGG